MLKMEYMNYIEGIDNKLLAGKAYQKATNFVIINNYMCCLLCSLRLRGR